MVRWGGAGKGRSLVHAVSVCLRDFALTVEEGRAVGLGDGCGAHGQRLELLEERRHGLPRAGFDDGGHLLSIWRVDWRLLALQ